MQMQPLISGSILAFFVTIRKWTSQIRQYQHIVEPFNLDKKNHITIHQPIFSNLTRLLKKSSVNCSMSIFFGVTGYAKCAAGWMEDFKGYWFDRTAKGCGSNKGYREWGQKQKARSARIPPVKMVYPLVN